MVVMFYILLAIYACLLLLCLLLDGVVLLQHRLLVLSHHGLFLLALQLNPLTLATLIILFLSHSLLQLGKQDFALLADGVYMG